jgi:hypothetical protein
VEKYGTARQVTGGNMIRHMNMARWITKTADTHSEYVIHIDFSNATMVARMHLNVMFIYTLPVLFTVNSN